MTDYDLNSDGQAATLALSENVTRHEFGINPISIVAGDVSFDVVQPVLANITPTAGSNLSARGSFSFDVTDPGGSLAFVLIQIWHGATLETVHDGDQFIAPYALLSTRQAITDGYRYTIYRAGGWHYPPRVRVRAFDTAGNELA